MPLSKKDSFTLQALQILDALLVWGAFWLAELLRSVIRDLFAMTPAEDRGLSEMTWVLYIAVPFTPLILERFGFYNQRRQRSSRATAWKLVQGMFCLGLIISLFAVFAQVSDIRRLILGVGIIIIYIFLFIRDRGLFLILKRRRLRGVDREKVIIAGSDAEITELLNDLDPESIASWEVVSRFDLTEKSSRELLELLKRESVGRVVFATKSIEFEKVAEAIEVCELQGVEAWIAASFIRTQIARPVFDSVGAKPMLVLRSTPELSWELMAKEMIDRTGSLIGILLTSPLWLFAYVGIKISSPGAPVFFSQMRAGRYGEPFKMWKFRTMVADAEGLLDKLKEEKGNQMDGPVFKLEHDPRIFRFGRLLRKLSIDELPQLINVLAGNMSLVGPRPLPLYEVEAFSEISHRRRLSVKPGITCEWQAGGRSKITSFEDWVEMDLRYIDNWSLWLDCQILLRTIPAVLFAKGAS